MSSDTSLEYFLHKDAKITSINNDYIIVDNIYMITNKKQDKLLPVGKYYKQNIYVYLI